MWLHWVADKDHIVGDVGNHRWEHVFIYVFSVFIYMLRDSTMSGDLINKVM